MKCNIGTTIINYDVIGSGKTIVIFSGFTNDMTTMKNCMEPIFKNKDNWKRIYVDHIGVGDTVRGDNIIDAIDVLDIMNEFVDRVIGEERFTLAGFSFGGYISRYVLNQKISQVEGLMLLNPLTTLEMGKIDIEKDIETINRRSEVIIEIDRRINEDINKAMLKTDFEFLNELQQKPGEVCIELDTFEGKFDKPVLILTGKQDEIVGYRDAFKLLGKYSRASYCVLDKAGHAVQIEQNKLFDILVGEWLSNVEESEVV